MPQPAGSLIFADPSDTAPMPHIDLDALDVTDEEREILNAIVDDDGRLREVRPDIRFDAFGQPTESSVAIYFVWMITTVALSPRQRHRTPDSFNRFRLCPDDPTRLAELKDLALRVVALDSPAVAAALRVPRNANAQSSGAD